MSQASYCFLCVSWAPSGSLDRIWVPLFTETRQLAEESAYCCQKCNELKDRRWDEEMAYWIRKRQAQRNGQKWSLITYLKENPPYSREEQQQQQQQLYKTTNGTPKED
jgi:hypothetical protein